MLGADLADLGAAVKVVDQTLAHFGRLDVLINNAACSELAAAEEIEPERMRRMLDVNFRSAVLMTNRAVPVMRRQHGGLVINIGSPGGFLGVPYYGMYAASKAALHGWTRSLQSEWAGSEIFVSEYQPGVIETELHEASLKESKMNGADRLFGREEGPAGAMQPVSADTVAADLVELIRHPRLSGYSSSAVRYGSVIAYVDGLRRRFMTKVGRDMRRRAGLRPFGGDA